MRPSRRLIQNLTVFMATLLMVLSAGLVAQATVILDSPLLPPEAEPDRCDTLVSSYYGQDVHAMFPGPIDLFDPLHECFQNVVRVDDGFGNEIETFDSVLSGMVDAGSGAIPFVLSGPVTTIVYGKTGNVTGTFDTEILSMSLTGNLGRLLIEVRESPTLASTGQTTIDDAGGGLWAIDSFFDVFTELSVDGSPFMPQTNGAGHMVLLYADDPIDVESASWGRIKSMYR